MNYKKQRNTIRSCTFTECPRGNLCPNYNPKYIKTSFNFKDCPYHFMNPKNKK